MDISHGAVEGGMKDAPVFTPEITTVAGKDVTAVYKDIASDGDTSSSASTSAKIVSIRKLFWFLKKFWERWIA